MSAVADPGGAVPTKYLVDTSAWLDALQRASGRETVRDRVRQLIASDQVVTIGAVRAEVLCGTRDDAEFRRLAGMLDVLERAVTTEDHWDAAADLGFRLRRAGRTVAMVDLLIAAVAQAEGLTVLHAD